MDSVASIKAALNKAAKVSKAAQNADDPAVLYMKSLKRVVKVVREAEAQKDAGSISEADWNGLLAHADTLTSELCFEQYAEDYTDSVQPYAMPEEEGNHLKTKTGMAFKGIDLFSKLFVRRLIDKPVERVLIFYDRASHLMI